MIRHFAAAASALAVLYINDSMVVQAIATRRDLEAGVAKAANLCLGLDGLSAQGAFLGLSVHSVFLLTAHVTQNCRIQMQPCLLRD